MKKILKSRMEALQQHDSLTATPPPPRKNFLIELSNICNDRCIFCANRKMTRKKGNINPAFLERILKEAFQLGVREVGFYTTGEPFTNTNLVDSVRLAKNIGFDYVYLTTNGALAMPENAQAVIDAGLDSIKFSINATTPQSYFLIHGKDDFDTVINNLTFVYNYKRQLNRPLNVFVSYIATRLTMVDKEQLEATFGGICDEIVSLSVINQIGLVPEIYEYLSLQGGEVDVCASRTLPCDLPFRSINVSFEGYLTACCTDFQNYLAYADLNKTSLQEAWTNKVITQFREQHLQGNISGTICDNCIRNIKTKPQPLCEDLASDFNADVMFNGEEVYTRIHNYYVATYGEHNNLI